MNKQANRIKKGKCHICNTKLDVQFWGLTQSTQCPKDHISIHYASKDLSNPYDEWVISAVFFKYRLGRKFYDFAFYQMVDKPFMSIRRQGILIASMFMTEYAEKYYGMSDKELKESIEVLETFS
jgi:hypothetical protein